MKAGDTFAASVWASLYAQAIFAAGSAVALALAWPRIKRALAGAALDELRGGLR